MNENDNSDSQFPRVRGVQRQPGNAKCVTEILGGGGKKWKVGRDMEEVYV